ncbi:P-loop containing nucleoside triphosphate hydrolase protein [Ilyonectria robusta]|uniref:P-loop containing nucleoside triphosphate hydrolase protein n=1 Tax=Ilyonectria robusta TaxID=1079257 RepID=UPI001E8E8CB9|nr:P-loop containing nucleoside triphosphate hydrolase protein [Ilyonectria robusta]KAH8663799.1 P-loop containing nucleoside triphosphate hydrolase protein [Ilyonectria robusta]
MSNSPQASLAGLDELSSSFAEIFDAIDSLRSAGLERELIPKLVVVGDQSSGKSSVLEAISQIPFPVDKDLCTRFPTEVVQRKSPEELVTVSIHVVEPTPKHVPSRDFSRSLSIHDTTKLIATIQEASTMILGASTGQNEISRFSNNILRIEVSGPERYPLTLVDLPGFFSSATENQSLADKELVDQMVEGYMREPRNALLLVISARVAYPNLRAPSEVSKITVDPRGYRSLGIVTGLDGPFNDDEDEVTSLFHGLQLKEGTTAIGMTSKRLEHQFKELGKSRSTEQSQRNYLIQMAKDFRLLASSAVDGHYGTATMPPHLQDFFDRGDETQQKRQDKKLQAVVRAMSQLFCAVMNAKGRTTRILQEPLEDDSASESSDAESHPTRRTRSDFEEHESSVKRPVLHRSTTISTEDGDEHQREDAILEAKIKSYEGILAIDVLLAYQSYEPSIEQTYDQVEERVMQLIARHRGKESLVEINPDVVRTLFREESSRWRQISRSHLIMVWEAVKRFVDSALEYCVDSSVLDDLRRLVIQDQLKTLLRNASKKHEELLGCHDDVNTAFYDAMEGLTLSPSSWRKAAPSVVKMGDIIGQIVRDQVNNNLTVQKVEKVVNGFWGQHGPLTRKKETFEAKGAIVHHILTKLQEFLQVDDLQSEVRDQVENSYREDFEKTAAQHAIKVVNEFYDISLVGFMLYMNAMVIQNCLLKSLISEVFTDDIVREMDAETLSAVAGEKEADAGKRVQYSNVMCDVTRHHEPQQQQD